MMTIKWLYLVCPECGTLTVVRGVSNENERKCYSCKAVCGIYCSEKDAYEERRRILRLINENNPKKKTPVYRLVKCDKGDYIAKNPSDCRHDDFTQTINGDCDYCAHPESKSHICNGSHEEGNFPKDCPLEKAKDE